MKISQDVMLIKKLYLSKDGVHKVCLQQISLVLFFKLETIYKQVKHCSSLAFNILTSRSTEKPANSWFSGLKTLY